MWWKYIRCTSKNSIMKLIEDLKGEGKGR
jgi:hypothetical protein